MGFESRAAGAVALPVAILGGIFGMTLVGAASYRRSALALARKMPPPPPVAAGKQVADTGVELVGRPLKATEVLTKGEIVRLFVVPGIFAGALVSVLGGVCRWSLDVDSVDDFVHQVRALFGSGQRPARIGLS